MNPHFNLSLPIAIGCDHAGVDYKIAIKNYLQQKGYVVNDFGTNTKDSVDYPDYAHAVANSVESNLVAFGILLCGSANGVCITANKHQQVRAGLAWNNDVAKLIRQHNNANIICLPARFIALPLALEMIDNFITTAFEGGRHENRVNKIACC
ncbi:MAG TPA: ribose 5-phosphate isomerase B [Chitinophagaceae bacterium]|nr:ribose 5-phosphate isomerase B [Chitinophagaceae bacterium]HMZ46606.1 ribose 5-phosphate isomerase B [Chitinophagaceae bacterium]HNE92578.1 ribose 5-phosphate isomerase B [Chitinophagaceae bacterium]HNF29507.1 ribose 5-phosphate isomerase B [Chitinophagaceae bacterium]HNJ58528.1 ribose 5-phosphate isomerase B [Chitinophagaceae bacterium]